MTVLTARYYKNPAKTAEAIDEQGWLHSGDIGLFTHEGNLKIVDRKKNIFKLSQGEYIAAEKIENAYLKSHLVDQVFLYGDSLQSCVVAIVVPNAANVKHFVTTHSLPGETLAEWVLHEDIQRAVEADLVRVAKEAKVRCACRLCHSVERSWL